MNNAVGDVLVFEAGPDVGDVYLFRNCTPERYDALSTSLVNNESFIMSTSDPSHLPAYNFLIDSFHLQGPFNAALFLSEQPESEPCEKVVLQGRYVLVVTGLDDAAAIHVIPEAEFLAEWRALLDEAIRVFPTEAEDREAEESKKPTPSNKKRNRVKKTQDEVAARLVALFDDEGDDSESEATQDKKVSPVFSGYRVQESDSGTFVDVYEQFCHVAGVITEVFCVQARY